MTKQFKKWPVLIISSLVILFLAIPVFAASSNFLQKATNYYQQNCLKTKISDSIAMSCFLFDKVKEIDQNIENLNISTSNLQNENTQLKQDVSTLSAKVKQLEDAQINLEEFTFFPHSSTLVHNQESPVIDTNGHKLMILTTFVEIGSGGFWLYKSDNQINWDLQYDETQTNNTTLSQRVIVVRAKYYKLKVVNSFTGSAFGILY